MGLDVFLEVIILSAFILAIILVFFTNTKTSGSETDKKIKDLIYKEITSEDVSVERFKTLLKAAKTLKIKIWD